MTSEEIEDLNDFVDHVHKMNRTSFALGILSQKSISISTVGDSGIWTFANFEEAECKEFLLDCRQITQHSDRVSMEHAWGICNRNLVNTDWWPRIYPPHSMMGDWFEQSATVADHNGNGVSTRIVFDTFLYGMYAHSDRAKKRLLSEWATAPRQYPALKLHFVLTLQVVLKCANDIAAEIEAYLTENGHRVTEEDVA